MTNMKNIYLIICLSIFCFGESSAQCTHTLNMYDSFGDGWNGSSVDVTVNGTVVVASATVS